MKFDPAALAKWRNRKAEIDVYVANGDMTVEAAHDLLKLYVSRLFTNHNADPPKRHLTVVK